MTIIQILLLVVAASAIVLAWLYLLKILRVPSRRYEGVASVANIYDSWTNGRILEYYWGEHLHAGHYGTPPIQKDFISAKVDFIDEMIKWGITQPNIILCERLENRENVEKDELVKILDVGCGIGGSVRHMAKLWPNTSHITGITISPAQVQRATTLACEQGIQNVEFLEQDALNMSFPDSSFDLVWAVESEMHMPDKKYFIQELARVLKPGGMLVIAAWNVRDIRHSPLSTSESEHLRLLVDEWAHAKFISTREYVEIFKESNLLDVAAEDWTVPTQPSWYQAVWVALRNPRKITNISMRQRWGLIRDAYTILRYHEAFRTRLCEYGMIRGQKAL